MSKKKETTRYILFAGTKFCQAEGNLDPVSCIHDDVINSDTKKNCIIKHELYKEFPTRQVKEINTKEIEATSCFSNSMMITPVLQIER